MRWLTIEIHLPTTIEERAQTGRFRLHSCFAIVALLWRGGTVTTADSHGCACGARATRTRRLLLLTRVDRPARACSGLEINAPIPPILAARMITRTTAIVQPPRARRIWRACRSGYFPDVGSHCWGQQPATPAPLRAGTAGQQRRPLGAIPVPGGAWPRPGCSKHADYHRLMPTFPATRQSAALAARVPRPGRLPAAESTGACRRGTCVGVGSAACAPRGP